MHAKLTPWEIDFCSNIERRAAEPTQKQWAVLGRLAAVAVRGERGHGPVSDLAYIAMTEQRVALQQAFQ